MSQAATLAVRPQFVENKLKIFPYIKEASFPRPARDGLRLINIDMPAGQWPKANLPYSDISISRRPEVYDLAKMRRQSNATLAKSRISSADPSLPVLHKELDPTNQLTAPARCPHFFAQKSPLR